MSSSSSWLPADIPVDADFGFAFNNSNYSDRILVIQLLADAKPEHFIDIVVNQHHAHAHKHYDEDAVTHQGEKNLNSNMPNTEDGVTNERQDEDVVAMMEESLSFDLNLPRTEEDDAYWSIESSKVVGVKTIHVSSRILAARSFFFRKLFSSRRSKSEQRHVTIRIHVSEEAALMELLKFMYSNTLPISSSSPSAILDILMVANKFEDVSCMNWCMEVLKNQTMTSECALRCLTLPPNILTSDEAQPLIDTAKKCFAFAYKDISKYEEELLKMPLAGIEAVLSSDDLQVACEDVVYDLALKWARIHYPKLEERQEVLSRRLGCLIRFPHMTIRKLKKVQRCTDFDPQFASKVILAALFFKTEEPYRQRSLASAETGVPPQLFMERAYEYHAIRVVEFEQPRRHCIVYLDLKRSKCAQLFPSGRIYSHAFHLSGQAFFLSAYCNMDEQIPYHCFGLFLGMQEKKSVVFPVDYEVSVRMKPRGAFESKYLGNYTFTEGKSIGYRNAFGVPWTTFIGEDSRFFINDVLHLRVELTLRQ